MEKIKIGVVEFSFYEERETITVDRIFIPTEHRGNHLAVLALKKLITLLSDRGKNLYFTVFPEVDRSGVDRKIIDNEYEKVRHILNRAGFTPDSEYRNDLTYYY